MKVIYTSIDNFRKENWIVKSYKELSQEFGEWIEETTCKLLQKRTKSEIMAGEVLKKKFVDIYAQPFFMIHGRSYFLDYYIPIKRIAVEIDGEYHKERKEIDRIRDKDFLSIGIRTIRVSAMDVLRGNFLEEFHKKEQKKPKVKKKIKNKKKRTGKQEESNMIKSARKRLREHDRMKHNAKWI